MTGMKDQIVLITGGAAGMGLASAKALAEEGATIIIADRNGEAAEHAAAAISATGGIAVAQQTDVSSLGQLRALFDFIEKEFGRLNVFFSNAGLGGANGFDVTEEQFDQVFDVNLKSHFFGTNFAVPLMRACAPQASIIYTSSIRGFRAHEGTPLYCMSKAGILMLARSAARWLGPDRIRVNAICPGGVETAFPQEWLGLTDEQFQAIQQKSASAVPLGRIGQPEEVAALVKFLASDQSLYITGTAMTVDGGSSA
ncbi:SDR family NAD(P)-dependent oxidoreductase [Sphingobium fuliginis]|uniref:SDR family oxidoreductase n=1 Tax=Sphingobium fuliginis ATCC 27551 TaxID=1208342 RepID=A0A5B8CG64_SPHSA|nr:SDR family oxidoreductase [Sphingobium fuliginis]QDC37256.1 SDR family oxidoreductase [Sphingobium fuliginis ATCC 27551]